MTGDLSFGLPWQREPPPFIRTCTDHDARQTRDHRGYAYSSPKCYLSLTGEDGQSLCRTGGPQNINDLIYEFVNLFLGRSLTTQTPPIDLTFDPKITPSSATTTSTTTVNLKLLNFPSVVRLLEVISKLFGNNSLLADMLHRRLDADQSENDTTVTSFPFESQDGCHAAISFCAFVCSFMQENKCRGFNFMEDTKTCEWSYEGADELFGVVHGCQFYADSRYFKEMTSFIPENITPSSS